ncbi:MAG: mechanosensitive ion channel family protein, partial [Pirellulaceae bacterium]
NDLVFATGDGESWRARVPKLFRDLSRAVLVAIGAMFIYSRVWGYELSNALTALGVGSVVIGLALQEPLGNIVSGLMLLFERPLNVGDWVVADGKTGKVIEINWRSVHIETATRELEIVPNVSLYKASFSN